MTRLTIGSLAAFVLLPTLASGQYYAAPNNSAVRPAVQQQPVGQQQPIAPQQPLAQQPIAPATPQQPAWVAQMSPDELKWVDDVLRYWEARSDKVKLFECQFQRWDYDGGPVDADGTRHTRTYAQGSIKYAQPDKGLYRVERLIATSPGAPGQKPVSVEQNPELGEHWICNGAEIYSFEASKKQVTVTSLPPAMRGQAIADGPLPFMFGAKAETIKARYWVRPLIAAPDDTTKQNRYWLEAVPKSRQDAQNFKIVRITLDKADYLPETLEIFAPHYDPPRNDARQKYVFSQRKTTDEAALNEILKPLRGVVDPFKVIFREFHEVKVPLGWKKVQLNDAVAVPAGPAEPAPLRQAEQPRAPQRQPLPARR
jgi:TIGR03009 family protein